MYSETSKPTHSGLDKMVYLERVWVSRRVLYIAISRFGTTGHVWYRGDFVLEGARFRGSPV